jgi:hypothetical protein
MTDANDVFELCCGKRGVPQDKSQKLIVLSLREKRLQGKIRRSYWATSLSMTADPLKKYDPSMPSFVILIEEGYLSFEGSMKVTSHKRNPLYTELDLLGLSPSQSLPSQGAKFEERDSCSLAFGILSSSFRPHQPFQPRSNIFISSASSLGAMEA